MLLWLTPAWLALVLLALARLTLSQLTLVLLQLTLEKVCVYWTLGMLDVWGCHPRPE